MKNNYNYKVLEVILNYFQKIILNVQGTLIKKSH